RVPGPGHAARADCFDESDAAWRRRRAVRRGRQLIRLDALAGRVERSDLEEVGLAIRQAGAGPARDVAEGGEEGLGADARALVDVVTGDRRAAVGLRAPG